MKIKHIYVTAKNPQNLAEFYERAGLSVRFSDGERWIQFKSDGAAFCVASIEESMISPSSNAVVVFDVGDLEAAVAQAAEMGAIVTGPIRDMGAHGRVAELRDPEGNAIQMFQSNRTTTP